jgi:hypothetical protein
MKLPVVFKTLLIALVLIVPSTVLFEANAESQSQSMVQSIMSLQSIDQEAEQIKQTLQSNNYTFSYINSLGVLENNSYSSLKNITNDSRFLNYLDEYSTHPHTYLTQALTYNFSSQQYEVYVMINVPRNRSQLTLSFAYASNNKTIYGPQITNESPLVSYTSSTFYGEGWAGYEFYDPGNGIKSNEATFNVTNFSLPYSITDYTAMAAWVGMTVTPGATDGNMIQTGYSKSHTGGARDAGWSPAQGYWDWWQTWMKGNDTYTGYYPNITLSYPGWHLDFSVNYVSSENKVYYELTAKGNNISQTTSLWNNYYVTSMYAQYIVEAPYSNNTTYGQSQIMVFKPDETFMLPTIVNTADISMHLNVLHADGYFNLYIMNQTSPLPNQNIYDLSTWQQFNGNWYWQPEMQWNDSNVSF